MNKNTLIIIVLTILALFILSGLAIVLFVHNGSGRIENSIDNISEQSSSLSEDDFSDFTYDDLTSENDKQHTNTKIDDSLSDLDKQIDGLDTNSDFNDFSTTDFEQ